MADLPHVGTPMFMVHSEDVNYRTRLEAVEDGTLALSAPLETVGNSAPQPGQSIDIFWAQPRARVILPCRIVKIAEEAPYQWILEPIGAPTPSNRREYVRGGGGPAVNLAEEPEEEQEEEVPPVGGKLVDISEGGLRCLIDRTGDLKVGDRLSASLRLDTGDVEVEGVVHTVRPAYSEPGYHVILTFDADETTKQLIRQHVFTWEIAERRRAAELR